MTDRCTVGQCVLSSDASDLERCYEEHRQALGESHSESFVSE